jgi:acetylornithine deacetylase/succinyl-diaminopimelate desuccinylase-like protein
MNATSQTIASALERVDRSVVLSQLSTLVGIPSPTGSEAEMARAYHAMMAAEGMQDTLQPVGDGRYNAIGRLIGTGGGKSLMFNGHLDTSFGGELGERGIGFRTEATIVDDEWVYGMGAFNMKYALAAYLEAVRAIKAAGIRLAGDVVIAGVAGEIEKAPIGEFEGAKYQGYGVGTKFAISHGAIADYCILGEPTHLKLVLAHAGSVWFKITVPGMLAHTAWTDASRNAITHASRVVDALNKWIPGYQSKHTVGSFYPRVNIAAIDGGWAWRGARSPDTCSIYVDVRTPPQLPLTEVLAEMRAVVGEVPMGGDGAAALVEVYCTNPGTELPEQNPLVAHIDAAHAAEFGQAPERQIENWYSDAAHMNRYGIASVNYGSAGRIHSGGGGWSTQHGEHVHIADMMALIRVYIRTILQICEVSKQAG